MVCAMQNIIDHSKFTLRVAEKDVGRLPEILKALTPAQILALQTNLARVWHRWVAV